MFVYLNVSGFTMAVPYEVLEIMGCPEYISLIFNRGKQRLILIPVKRSAQDLPKVKIPDIVYRRKAAFVLNGAAELSDLISSIAGITEHLQNIRFSADAAFLYDDDLAQVAGINVHTLVSSMSVYVDLSQWALDASVREGGVIEAYTTGGYEVGIQ